MKKLKIYESNKGSYIKYEGRRYYLNEAYEGYITIVSTNTFYKGLKIVDIEYCIDNYVVCKIIEKVVI